MFKCQACGANSLPREKQTKVVLYSRKRSYYNPESETNTNSIGTEIMSEISVGSCCAEKSYQQALFNHSPANPANFGYDEATINARNNP